MFTCQASAAKLRVYCHNDKLKTETTGWLVTCDVLEALNINMNVIYN
jgi:hypothetical protein